MILREKIKLKSILNLREDIVLAENSFVAAKALYADSVCLNQNPVLALALQQIRLANANKNVEKALRKPDFTAGYFVQSLTGNQDVEGQSFYYNGIPRFQGVNFGISIPLFGKASKARIQAAETEVLVQQKNTEYFKNQLNSQLLQQIEEQKVNQSLIDYYAKTALPNAETIGNNALRAFQNGEIGYVEYLQSLETVLSIQQNHLNAVKQFNQNNINIQYLLNN
jgi:cobalt-zinc-cadmium resistance protein CzcA